MDQFVAWRGTRFSSKAGEKFEFAAARICSATITPLIG
jgi:hypothetical protein